MRDVGAGVGERDVDVGDLIRPQNAFARQAPAATSRRRTTDASRRAKRRRLAAFRRVRACANLRRRGSRCDRDRAIARARAASAAGSRTRRARQDRRCRRRAAGETCASKIAHLVERGIGAQVQHRIGSGGRAVVGDASRRLRCRCRVSPMRRRARRNALRRAGQRRFRTNDRARFQTPRSRFLAPVPTRARRQPAARWRRRAARRPSLRARSTTVAPASIEPSSKCSGSLRRSRTGRPSMRRRAAHRNERFGQFEGRRHVFGGRGAGVARR